MFQVRSSFLWSSLNVIFVEVVSFLFRIYLISHLLPDQYGWFVAANTVYSFVKISSDLGLPGAFVQKEHLDTKSLKNSLSSIFWFTFVATLLFVTVLYLTSPLLFDAWLGEESPAIYLAAMSVGLLFVPLMNITYAHFERIFNFRFIFLVNLTALLASVILAMVVSRLANNIWALVVFQTALPIIKVFITLGASDNLISPSFRFSDVKSLFGFAKYELMIKFVTHITQNIDIIIIGKIIGAAGLGLYSLAMFITELARQQIMSVVSKVMFPLYSRLKREPQKIGQYYLLTVKYNTLIIGPILSATTFFSFIVLPTVMSEGWDELPILIALISIGSLIHCIGGSNTSVMRGMGRVKEQFRIYLVKTIIFTVPAYLAFTWYFGLLGAGFAYIVHKIIGRILYQIKMRQLLDVTNESVLRAASAGVLVTLIYSSIYAAVYFFVHKYSDIIQVSFSLLVIFIVCSIHLLYLYRKLKVVGEKDVKTQ